ncbi:LOC100363193 [Phodopus roborovskii]|uniref:LOC100363193 protein n=1 Tax=Phodopus roborovskii TaxID=109678 RepID=A0AAU9Z7R7_PHORO|nr:LOC100363193 [Phodopus roborovskii]
MNFLNIWNSLSNFPTPRVMESCPRSSGNRKGPWCKAKQAARGEIERRTLIKYIKVLLKQSDFPGVLMVGKAKWKPLKLPLPAKTMSQRQCCIPGGTEEISAAIKDLKDAGPDYGKLDQVVTPIAAAIPDVVFLLEQINTSPGMYTSPTWVLLLSMYQVIWKAASFEWSLEQEMVLQQVQAVVQAALPLGPYDAAGLMVQEVSVTDEDAVWSLLEQGCAIICRQLFSLCQTHSWKTGEEGIQGRSMWIELSKWTKRVTILVSHVNAHLKVTSAEKKFNNQHLSSAIPVIAHEQCVMVAEMGVMHGLDNMDFYLPRLTWLQLLLNASSANSRDQHLATTDMASFPEVSSQ